MKRGKQLSFEFRSHGGLRKNAGRPRLIADELPHTAREVVDARVPMHLNFKLIPQAPSLRTPKFMREFPKILANARRCGLNIQQYTIETNHVHILCEAESNEHVKRGMISFKSSIVWALRRIFGFHGIVFADRYHAHLLKTPTEMRNALRYVLFNHAKHTKTAFFADVYSSIYGFEDASMFVKLRYDRPPPWFAAIRLQMSKAKLLDAIAGMEKSAMRTREQSDKIY